MAPLTLRTRGGEFFGSRKGPLGDLLEWTQQEMAAGYAKAMIEGRGFPADRRLLRWGRILAR